MTTISTTSRRRALKLGLAATLAAPAVARAQQGWPNGPITWVNPFPAGGGTDVFARPLAAQVGEQLGVQILIDNKGGAGGTVGASQAAKMKPDGQTFFVGAIHHTIAPSVYKNLDYDLEKNFEPITMVALVPQVIAINPTRVPIGEKESVRWVENLVEATAALGAPGRCVHIGDREADIYELFCAANDGIRPASDHVAEGAVP